jgi:hypothetical protein
MWRPRLWSRLYRARGTKGAGVIVLNAVMLPFLAGGCASGKTIAPSKPASPPQNSSVTVSVSPTAAILRVEESQTFTATVTGNSNTAVLWSVNGTAGGSAALGLISPSGVYTAPATLPSANPLNVTAASAADSSVKSSGSITVFNPTPVLNSISPLSVNTGAYTLMMTGSKFVSGAKVLVNGTAITTTFVSATQLTAAGNAGSAGTFSVVVQNPDPGSSKSSALSLQVDGSQPPQSSSCGTMALGQGSALNGFLPFPRNSLWNTDISTAPVDTNSAATINYIGGTIGLHADFGAGQYQNSYIGIPYTVVDSSQAPVVVTYNAYGDESDAGPMPIPLSAPVEGYPNPGNGDRHVLVLDRTNCFLYELYGAATQSGTWTAGSGAIWDLLANSQRPYGWTSADAAGLPIFPGLIRYDEVASGAINHAIRFTLQSSRAAIVPPASHFASTTSNANAAPMGMKLRLKSSFNVSGFSTANQVILNAMKKYGLIMADNGSSMYISGAPDERWDNDDLHDLASVKASDFEVVQIPLVYTAANMPTGVAPAISQFTANSMSVVSGSSVTLSWLVTGASVVIVSPEVGAVRASSVAVTPSTTTKYTLYATNAFGQSKATVTITVH